MACHHGCSFPLIVVRQRSSSSLISTSTSTSTAFARPVAPLRARSLAYLHTRPQRESSSYDITSLRGDIEEKKHVVMEKEYVIDQLLEKMEKCAQEVSEQY